MRRSTRCYFKHGTNISDRHCPTDLTFLMIPARTGVQSYLPPYPKFEVAVAVYSTTSGRRRIPRTILYSTRPFIDEGPHSLCHEALAAASRSSIREKSSCSRPGIYLESARRLQSQSWNGSQSGYIVCLSPPRRPLACRRHYERKSRPLFPGMLGSLFSVISFRRNNGSTTSIYHPLGWRSLGGFRD